MCGAILRPFNSLSCRWEGGNDMCVLDPVYSRKDCRLQLIPGTARFNLPSYRNSNSFQTWPCRYNYVHLIQCYHTHNLKHLLLIALASQYYKSARYNELASRYLFSLLQVGFSLLRVGCSLLRYGFSLFRVGFSLIRVGFS